MSAAAAVGMQLDYRCREREIIQVMEDLPLSKVTKQAEPHTLEGNGSTFPVYGEWPSSGQ